MHSTGSLVPCAVLPAIYKLLVKPFFASSKQMEQHVQSRNKGAYISFVYKGFAAKDSRIRRVHFLRSKTKQFTVKAISLDP